MPIVTKKYLRKIGFTPDTEITKYHLLRMFIWESTHEGFEYWSNISKKGITLEVREKLAEMHRVYNS